MMLEVTLVALMSALLICGGQEQAEPLSVEQLIQRKLPAGDDWPTEVLHEHAKNQLKKLGKRLADPQWRAKADVSGLVAEGCTVSPLRPLKAGQNHRLGKTVVHRAADSAGRETRRHDIPGELASLMAPYGQIGGQRFAFKALRVQQLKDDGRFSTTMFYECFGPAPTGIVEQHAIWKIAWGPGPDPEHPLITEIAVSDFKELHAAEPHFADRTAALLGPRTNAWEQLRQGADYWHHLVDSLGGVTFLGHQGLALGDLNGDGLDDVYVAQSTGMPNLMLLQEPDGTVTDRAHAAGVDFLDDTKGVLIVDIDNDGDQDLCCAMGPTVLVLANNGKAVFTPMAALHAPDPSDFYSLTAVDYDEDGDLDLYAARYVTGRYGVAIPVPWQDANNGPSNHMFRNDGAGRFTDVTRDVGLDVNNRRFSLAAGWVDYDGDRDLDLYVANDFGRNNLYRNEGGRFNDVAATSGTEDQAAGMGVSWADYDLDGDVDLHVGNMFSSAGNRIAYQRRFHGGLPSDELHTFQRHAWGNSLYRNEADGTFTDASGPAGIRMGRWSWGARFVDVNNDGYPDILSPNGFLTNSQKDDL